MKIQLIREWNFCLFFFFFLLKKIAFSFSSFSSSDSPKMLPRAFTRGFTLWNLPVARIPMAAPPSLFIVATTSRSSLCFFFLSEKESLCLIASLSCPFRKCEFKGQAAPFSSRSSSLKWNFDPESEGFQAGDQRIPANANYLDLFGLERSAIHTCTNVIIFCPSIWKDSSSPCGCLLRMLGA